MNIFKPLKQIVFTITRVILINFRKALYLMKRVVAMVKRPSRDLTKFQHGKALAVFFPPRFKAVLNRIGAKLSYYMPKVSLNSL